MEVGGCQYGYFCGFPRTRRKHDSIWVIIYRMTKASHFFTIKFSYSSKDYAMLYLNEIVRMHWIPLSIISDRGTQLTSHFFTALSVDMVPR